MREGVGMEDRMVLSFNIQGKFIARLAREWLFCEGKDIEMVMDLLLSCMSGTEMKQEELKRHAEDILLGRADFDGNTADGTFHMTTYDPSEQPKVPEQFDIFRRLSVEIARRKKAEEERDRYREWYSVAMEYVPEFAQNEVLEETGQPIKSRYGNDMLGSFMERMMDKKEHSTEDYGWLEPDGTFHEVEWGNHQEWAQRYIEENFPEVAEDDGVDMQTKCNVGLIGAGDWLVERGWVLLHSPSQGIAQPTKIRLRGTPKSSRSFCMIITWKEGKNGRQMLCTKSKS